MSPQTVCCVDLIFILDGDSHSATHLRYSVFYFVFVTICQSTKCNVSDLVVCEASDQLDAHVKEEGTRQSTRSKKEKKKQSL